MSKDFKIGMGLGLLIVAVAVFWFMSRSNSKLDVSVSYGNEQPADQVVSGEQQAQAMDIEKAQSLLQRLEKQVDEKELADALEMEWPRIHVVRKGQTLSQISQQYYGTASKWQKILDANRLRLKNKDQIRPDMRLVIPE